jgi:zinc transporter 1
MLAVGGAGLAINIVSLILFWLQEKCTTSDDDGDEEASPVSYDNKAAEFDDIDEKSDGKNKESSKPKKEIKKASDNMNMKAVFLNALGDSLGSVAVVISGLLVIYVPPKGSFEGAKWKEYVDPVLSLIIATIIISTIIPLLKKSSMIILQTVPNELDFSQIKKDIQSVKGVTNVHHFHIWSLNPEKLVASAHIRVNGDADDEDNWRIVNSVKKILHTNNIHSTTIQLEDDTVSLDSCDISMCPKDSKCCDQTPHDAVKVNNVVTQF